MGRRKLLLLEFVNTRRRDQVGGEAFPFVQGWARQVGLDVRWVGLGVPPERMPEFGGTPTLDEAAVARLRACCGDADAAHLLATHPLPETAAVELPPGLRVAALADRFERAPNGLALWLARWLELPTAAADIALVDDVSPDFAMIPLDDEARGSLPPLRLVTGAYRYRLHPVSRSPFFRPDETAGHYVVGLDGPSPFRTPPVALALRQLAAARASLGPDRQTTELAFFGAGVFCHLDELARTLAAAGEPPLRLLFSVPPAVILRAAPRVAEALPLLAQGGHAALVANVAPVNFSAAECARIDHTPPPEVFCAAEDQLVAWERSFASTVGGERLGGFGVALFTPWTTLGDLRENVAAARAREIRSQHHFATSKLRLVPDSAAAERAARDGLLVERFDPAVFGDHDPERGAPPRDRGLAWRFARPEVELVYRFAARLAPADGDPSPTDPLFATAQILRRVLPEGLRDHTLATLDLLVTTAADLPEGTDTRGFLDAVLRRAGVPGAWSEFERDDEPRGDPPPTAHAEDARAVASIRGTLEGLTPERRERLQGYRVETLAAGFNKEGDRVIDVSLQREDARLVLNLLPRGAVRGCFAMTSAYAICYHEDTPVDTREKELAVQAFADLIDEAL